MTMKTGDEKLGVIHALAQFFRMGIGRVALADHFEKVRLEDKKLIPKELKVLRKRKDKLPGHDHMDNVAYLFEMVLCLERFLCSKNPQTLYWNANDNQERIQGERDCVQAFRTLMLTVKYVTAKVLSLVDKEKDTETQVVQSGWKNPKFHQLLHFPAEISAYGSPLNTDTSSDEHNHIKLVKIPGATSVKHTQKQLYEGIASRTHETMLVGLAETKFGLLSRLGHDKNQTKPLSGLVLTGSHYNIHFQNADPALGRWKLHQVEHFSSSQSGQADLPIPVLAYLRRYFYSQNRETGVLVCTEMKRSSETPDVKEETFRCHPKYQNGTRWMDWVFVKGREINKYLDVGIQARFRARLQREGIGGAQARQQTKMQWSVNQDYPCQLCCFVIGMASCPGNLDVPLAVLRLSCDQPEAYKGDFAAILMDRYEKIYDADGEPIYCVMPATLLLHGVMVREDFPVLFQDKSGFERARRYLLNSKHFEELFPQVEKEKKKMGFSTTTGGDDGDNQQSDNQKKKQKQRTQKSIAPASWPRIGVTQ